MGTNLQNLFSSLRFKNPGYYIFGVVTGLVLALFIAALSGGSKRIRRKVAAVAVFTPLLGFVISEKYFFDWLAPVTIAVLLFLSSLLCGERKIHISFSAALIAVNVMAVIDSVMQNVWFFANRPSTNTIPFLLYSGIVNSVGKKAVSLIILTVVLALICIIVRKRGFRLEGREKWTFAISLFVTTVIIIISQEILEGNLEHLILKVFRLGTSQKAVWYSVAVIVSALVVDVTVYALLVIVSRHHRKETEQVVMGVQYANQKTMLEEASRQREIASKISHDLKNVLGTVDGLISSGKYEEASAFIRTRTGSLPVSAGSINTNNEYVNSLINYKSAAAKEKGIDLSVYSISEIVFPDNVDFCILIGNMFDNAIRAAAECDGARTVRLDISRIGNGYRIIMLNSVPEPVLAKNPTLETTKDDGASHGFGTRIIKETAEKYYGTTDFYDTDDGKFCCSVIVYPEKPF